MKSETHGVDHSKVWTQPW